MHWVHRFFPATKNIGAGELMVLPIVIGAVVVLLSGALIYIGDWMGLAYGERLDQQRIDGS
jgi:hypothetical protein